MRKQELTWYTPSELLPKVGLKVLITYFGGYCETKYGEDDDYDELVAIVNDEYLEISSIDEWAYI